MLCPSESNIVGRAYYFETPTFTINGVEINDGVPMKTGSVFYTVIHNR